jgi:hypothetical protein
MSKVNMLRMLEIYVGTTGDFKRVVILQEIYRKEPSKMKGCDLKLLNKVKRFGIWLDILKENGFVKPDFFEDKIIMIRNSFHGYNSELPELKKYQVEKSGNDPRFPVNETIVIDLSGYVFLEFKFHKIFDDKRIGNKVFIPVKLGEDKPDSNEFCKLLVLEEYRDKAFELPPLPKKAEMFTCWARLELAPDSKNDSGATITEYEFEMARKGIVEGNIV